MPGFEERLKRHLERLAPPADPSGAFDRILEKKIKRRLVRRAQAAGLALAVLAATVGGTFALVRVFRSSGSTSRLGDIRPTPGPVTNGRIAYASDENGNYDIWTATPDGTGPLNLTSGSGANETNPAWSPDGMSIAFVTDRDGNREIYAMDRAGGEQVRLTQSPGMDLAPAWSPDGKRIAYVSSVEDDFDLFVMNADGSDVRRVKNEGSDEGHPTWSPDGSRIAFSSTADPFGPTPDSSGIYVINPDGSGKTKVTKGPDAFQKAVSWPDWSPDGKRIAFARAGDIYVMGSDGSDLRKLTEGEKGNSPSARPAWSPDGKKIVFERIPGAGTYEIHTMNADGSDLRWTDLTAAGSDVLAPDWQPITAETLPSVSPTTGAVPTTSPLPGKCDASQVTGDFEGDDALDLAVVAKTDCLLPPEDRQQDSIYTTEHALDIQWFAPEGGHPAEGIAPLPECRKACQALAAADLNGDGIDEFILKVDAGASTDFFQVYEVDAIKAFGRPAIVAPPGAPPRFAPSEAAEFALFGSVTHYDAFGCDLINKQVIVQSAELNSERMRWSVHETLLRFDPTEDEPFGKFTVVSSRDYTEPAEENVGPGDQFEPGDPCWI